MVVAVCQVDLHLVEEPDNLKGKRHIVKKLKDRIKSRFDVSIAEVEDTDKWQRASLGIACVTNEHGRAQQVMSSVLDFINKQYEVEITGQFLDYQTY